MSESDSASSSNQNQSGMEIEEKLDEAMEPEKKRARITPNPAKNNKLEQRLGGILCCAVCLDLPIAVVYQVIFYFELKKFFFPFLNFHVRLLIFVLSFRNTFIVKFLIIVQ